MNGSRGVRNGRRRRCVGLVLPFRSVMNEAVGLVLVGEKTESAVTTKTHVRKNDPCRACVKGPCDPFVSDQEGNVDQQLQGSRVERRDMTYP